MLMSLVLGMFPTSARAALPHIFNDGFESGDLSNWTTVNGLVVQQDEVYAGDYAARGTSTGTPTYAYKQLSQTYGELYYRLWFKIVSQGANQVVVQRFRTATNTPILAAFVGQTGKLSLRNEITNANVASDITVTQGVWHQLQVRIKIDEITGIAGESEVWFNGVRIDQLSISQDLGTNLVGSIQLGESSNLRTYDIALDRVAVDTEFIDPVDPPETSPDINVWVAGEQEGTHPLEHNEALQVNYPGVNQGPVQIMSSTADTVVGSEAVIYSVNGTPVSFSEMMGLPNGQLDKRYWLPWYNNKDLNTQLRIGNVSNATANVQVFIGGTEVDSFSFGPGESRRRSYNNIDAGPVEIVSDQDIVTAERVIYTVNGAQTSFSEMMALPHNQLNNTYWLPWYNNKDLNTQLRIANVTDQEATVHVFIGGEEMSGSPFTLAADASRRLSYPGVDRGPVEIVSNRNIVAAERVIYNVNGAFTSFSEMMGLPKSQLNNTYWLPWYDNQDFNTQLRIGNVSNATANVQVFIGGVEVDSFSFGPGESRRRSYPTADSGPVEIVSDQDIVAAERVIYTVNGVNTSFSEMMGLPELELDTTYWLPWYNNVELFTELRLGVP
jgi:hypothetical protein